MQVVAGVSAIHRLLELVPQAAEFSTPFDETLPNVMACPVCRTRRRECQHWTVSNDSAAGWPDRHPDTPLNLKVGDAMALRAKIQPCVAGVIRWIKMLDARQVELGVERLSPQVQPVWYGRCAATARPARTRTVRAGLPGLRQPDRLLLPSHIYQIGMDAEVWHSPGNTR